MRIPVFHRVLAWTLSISWVFQWIFLVFPRDPIGTLQGKLRKSIENPTFEKVIDSFSELRRSYIFLLDFLKSYTPLLSIPVRFMTNGGHMTKLCTETFEDPPISSKTVRDDLSEPQS